MNTIVNKITFPEFKGIKCNMMPFIQGDSSTIPEEYKSYSDIIDNNFLQLGEIGYLTIEESFVKSKSSQRGFNSFGIDRNVHIEVGRKNGRNKWGSNTWGSKDLVTLHDSTEVLIANNVDNTCMFWDQIEKRETEDGDLGEYISDYDRKNGILLKNGDLAKISIFTPHECLYQKQSGFRQFFRIVGSGVNGRESYFTTNHLIQ